MGKIKEQKDRRRRTRRIVLGLLIATIAVGCLAYNRDAVLEDATQILHHTSLSTPATMELLQKAPVHIDTTPATPAPGDPTIFVAMIAYREPECHPTLANMFKQAVIPERVFAGVCQQNFLPAGSEEDCAVIRLPPKLQPNVRLVQMNSTKATGVAPARAVASGQYGGQNYWLQIDGHSRFDYGWDQRLIDELEKLKKCSPNPVISTYPPGIEMIDDSEDAKKTATYSRICNGTFEGGPLGGMFRFAGGAYPANGFAVRVPFAAGGFMFGPGTVLRDIAFDSNLPFMFDGEEVMLSVRLFTHGYDVFAPSTHVVYHRYINYGGRKVNVFVDHAGTDWRDQAINSTKRAAYLLGITEELPPEGYRQELEKYGPGKVRTMAEWAAWSGVDFKNPSVVTAGDKFCREDIPLDSSRICPISQEAQDRFKAANQ